ncbi:MAG: hypothetical protein Q6373_022810 [Candidatus Sigynarchaeota archaeon]
MEIDKSSTIHKETAWKIKLDKNVVLVLNAIEDSSLPEPTVSVILSDGDKKVDFTIPKEKFLNLTGVLDSFSQVCLGVEPVLAQEDYAVKEPKAREKKVETAEPAPAPKPKVERVEPPVPAVPAAPARPPEPISAAPAAPAVPARQPEHARAPTAESRMLAKLDGAKPSPPPKVAFPPRFPVPLKTEEEEEEEPAATEDEQAKQAVMDDISELDFSSPKPEPAPASPAASVQARVTINPPVKPTPPAVPTRVSAAPAPPPAKPAPQKDEEEEAAPEWDPW